MHFRDVTDRTNVSSGYHDFSVFPTIKCLVNKFCSQFVNDRGVAADVSRRPRRGARAAAADHNIYNT